MLTDYHTARTLETSHRCPTCRNSARLVCRWNGPANSYEVVCGRCGQGERFEARKSLTQQWRDDPESVPVHVANRLELKYGGKPMDSTALTTTSEQAMTARLSTARWLNDLNPQDRKALALLSVQYGLDPLMGELTIYESRPFIALAGYIRMAHRQPSFEGLEDRPMATEERDAYGIVEPIGWIAKVYRAGWRVPAVGTGAADPKNPYRNNPVERTRPQWMARSRAIRQALKLAYPHALPWAESAEDAGITIDTRTGEVTGRPLSAEGQVVEATWHEAEEVAEPITARPGTEPKAPAVTPANSPVRPTSTSAAEPIMARPPAKPTTPKPASQSVTKPPPDHTQLLRDWDALWAEAKRLGVTTNLDPLASNATDEQIKERGRELAALVRAARAKAQASEPAPEPEEAPLAQEPAAEQVAF